jgi:hypothetical protein
MNRLIVGLTVALLLTAVVATSVSASSDDVVRSPDGTAFKGDTTPGAVPVCRVDGGEATISSLSLAYMFYNCDIWFNYVYQPTNESSVEGWSWTEVHQTSDYNSPMVEVDSIYANQRLWKDSTLIDSDLHSAITNAASDDADVYRGGCSPTDPMFYWFHSTSYHRASDSYYGTAYSTDSDDF